MRKAANSLPPTDGEEPSPLTDYRNKRALLKSSSMPPPSEDSEVLTSDVDRRTRLQAARRRSNSSAKPTSTVPSKYPPPRRASSRGRTTPPRPQQRTAAPPPQALNDSRAVNEEAARNHESKPTPSQPTPIMSADHVRAILEENDRLRVIEREFWNLLNEREDLKAEVATLTTAQNSKASSERHIDTYPSPTAHPSPTNTNTNAIDARRMRSMEVEVERLQLALHEAMELLLADELKRGGGDLPGGVGNIRRDGPVSAFVNWLSMVEEKRQLDGELQASRSEMEKWTVSGAPQSSPEKKRNRSLNEALRNTVPVEQYNEALGEVKQSHIRVRRIQEELDRTDLSRQQALEDVEVLRSQLEQLNGSFKEVSQALVAHRSHHQQGGGDGGREVGLLKDTLYQREEEIKHLRAQMRRLVEDADRRSHDLASDTERIRRDVFRRSASREPSVAVHEVHDMDL